MSKLFLSVCAAAVLAVVPVYAGDDEAKAVLDKAIKARGGADTNANATTAKGKGTLFINDMNGEFKLQRWLQAPNKERSVINISIGGMDIEVVSVLAGVKGWRTVLGQTNDLNEEEVKDLQFQFYHEVVTQLVSIPKDKGMKISSLGETKVRDKAVVGIQVRKKDERDINLYFDKSSYQLVKTECQNRNPVSNAEAKQEVYYSEFKELIPGVKTATKLEIFHDGKKLLDFELTEVGIVESHDDSIFAKPG